MAFPFNLLMYIWIILADFIILNSLTLQNFLLLNIIIPSVIGYHFYICQYLFKISYLYLFVICIHSLEVVFCAMFLRFNIMASYFHLFIRPQKVWLSVILKVKNSSAVTLAEPSFYWMPYSNVQLFPGCILVIISLLGNHLVPPEFQMCCYRDTCIILPHFYIFQKLLPHL